MKKQIKLKDLLTESTGPTVYLEEDNDQITRYTKRR